MADKKNLLLLALQPLVVGLALAYVLPADFMKLFFAHISVLWLGSNNSAQEIVKELPIYRRERFVGLNPFAYLSSKFVFGFALTLLQGAIIYSCMATLGTTSLSPESSGAFTITSLVLTAMAANAIGLAISAFSRSIEIALFTVPLFLIPQILLSGGVVQIPDWDKVPEIKMIARWMPGYASQRIMDTGRVWKQDLRQIDPLGDKSDIFLSAANLNEDFPSYQLAPSHSNWNHRPFDDKFSLVEGVGKLAFYTFASLLVCYVGLRLRERE